MRKKVERLVIIAFICFVVFKILTFGQEVCGQEVCEGVSNMATNHYTELETLVNEF